MWSLLLACAPPDPDAARAARLRDWLLEDSAPWLSRDPALLEAKFAKMAADPYDFLRGTTGWWWAELARSDPDRPPTAFLTTPDAATTLLVGDLHLENAGACLPGLEVAPVPSEVELTFEAVDLDTATFGPWTLDPRRTALSLALVTSGLDGCEDDCVDAVLGAFAWAFVDEVQAPTWNGTGWGADGAALAALDRRARAEGVAQAELGSVTEIVEEVRVFRHEEVDASGDGLLPLTPEEERQLGRLLDGWSARPAGFRYLAGARRYGAGVASLPAVRYAVLWDSGDAAWSDDRLLNVREVVSPPPMPGLGDAGAWESLAARVDALPDHAWARRDSDVLYGAAVDGAQTFKFTAWSGWFQTVDHGSLYGDWIGGDVSQVDLEALAAVYGHLLAAADVRAPTSSGRHGGDVLRAELSGREDAWVAEAIRDAHLDLARLSEDHGAFLRLLDAYGSLAGIDAAGAW